MKGLIPILSHKKHLIVLQHDNLQCLWSWQNPEFGFTEEQWEKSLDVEKLDVHKAYRNSLNKKLIDEIDEIIRNRKQDDIEALEKAVSEGLMEMYFEQQDKMHTLLAG